MSASNVLKNEADLDSLEVTPWLLVTSNNFYMHFPSNSITKNNDLGKNNKVFTEYH